MFTDDRVRSRGGANPARPPPTSIRRVTFQGSRQRLQFVLPGRGQSTLQQLEYCADAFRLELTGFRQPQSLERAITQLSRVDVNEVRIRSVDAETLVQPHRQIDRVVVKHATIDKKRPIRRR